MKIYRIYKFEAAHSLPMTPPDHKCHGIHGHNFTAMITLDGSPDPHLGWLVDFGVIDAIWDQLIFCEVDHKYLNHVDGLDNPTSENIARWIWDLLTITQLGPLLLAVSVSENDHSGAVYEGP